VVGNSGVWLDGSAFTVGESSDGEVDLSSVDRRVSCCRTDVCFDKSAGVSCLTTVLVFAVVWVLIPLLATDARTELPGASFTLTDGSAFTLAAAVEVRREGELDLSSDEMDFRTCCAPNEIVASCLTTAEGFDAGVCDTIITSSSYLRQIPLPALIS
jgi:hypothetical protein